MNYQKEDIHDIREINDIHDISEINDSIEWLCNPQLEYSILQHENKSTQSTTNVDINDILHDNIQQFIEHYGVIDKSSQNNYIKDIRKLIFDWIRIDNIDITHVQKKSLHLFTQMKDIKHICSIEWFYMVDTLT